MNKLDQKILDYFNKYESSWVPGYGGFPRVLSDKKLEVGVEVGVAFGGHSESILQNSKVKHLYGIDPFKHIAGYDDPMNLPQSEFDALYKFTKKRLAKYGSRYTLIREFSDKAASSLKNNLDFVYIDADHSYGGVKNDIALWYPKVREGGIVAGHDYGHVDFPGVKQAIDEFAEAYGYTIHKEGEGVWWTEKKSPPISFIMPAYNAQRTIKGSVTSIFNGNLAAGDELIIVDDHSTDKTAQVIKELQKVHPEIKLLTHKFNKGGGAARNTAVENTNNDLIFCLDSDNILAPGSIPPLREYLITTKSDIATFGAVRYFKTSPKKVTHQWKYEPSSATVQGALSTNRFPGSSGNYLFTKASWIKAGRYPEFAGAMDTWGFGFRQVAADLKMSPLPDSFYLHRWGYESYWVRESLSGTVSLKALQLLIPYLDLLNEDDINYIMAENNRSIWFDNLEQRPIRLKREDPKPALHKKIANILKR